MKKILLLGGSAQQIIAIKKAKELGLYTVLCDYLTHNPGQKEADKFYLVSTTDKKAVLEVAKKEHIDGILAYASDPAAPTAAYVAEKLGLPGNPYKTVNMLCNKNLFRAFLKENGFACPDFFEFQSSEEAIAASESFRYPMIIKPVDSSGSKGVTVLQNREHLKDAIDFAFSFSRAKKIIAEQFIEKKHKYLIGGDIFVRGGKIVVWGLMNCHRDSKVNPLVPTGKSYPLMLDETDAKKVKATLQTIIDKSGFQDGSMNVELIIGKDDQVYPIDIGPRGGGNMIPDLINDIFGIDVISSSVFLAMGDDIPHFDVKDSGEIYATYNLHSSVYGDYQGISFSEEIEKYIYRKCIYKKTGQFVKYFDNAAKAVGIIFLKFPNKETFIDTMNNIESMIDIDVIPTSAEERK